MPVLTVLHHPDPQLRQVAAPVTEFNEKLQIILKDMVETMYDYNGVGLAATQVGIHQRIAVMDVSENRDTVIYAINPEIIHGDGAQIDDHGCLSVPGIYGGGIKRFAKVRMRALDQHGKSYELDAEGTLAICIQHEIDHLNGKLFIDHLSPLKLQRIKKKCEKLKRRTPSNE